MSLCYYYKVWGLFQWKTGIVSYHRNLTIPERVCSFKIITALPLTSVNKFLMPRPVCSCVFSCFNTQIHPYIHLQTSGKITKKNTLFLPTLFFLPHLASFLLNYFEWCKYFKWEYSKITDAMSICFLHQVRDTTQEPCGRLSFMKEPKSTRGLVHQAICNLNITLPVYTKVLWNDTNLS